MFGFPQHVVETEHLLSLQLSPAQAAWVIDYLDQHGCVFDQWNIEPKVTRLVAALHSAT